MYHIHGRRWFFNCIDIVYIYIYIKAKEDTNIWYVPHIFKLTIIFYNFIFNTFFVYYTGLRLVFKKKKKKLWSKIPPWTDHKHSTQIFLTCFIGLMVCRYYFFYWVWQWVMWWLALSFSFFHTSISDVSTCHIIKFSIKIN